MALLQIAVETCVYLVDFVQLEGVLKPEQWNAFFTALLKSQSIKLGKKRISHYTFLNSSAGFDFINDLRALFHSTATREFKELELNNNNCVCIKLLMENVCILRDLIIFFRFWKLILRLLT